MTPGRWSANDARNTSMSSCGVNRAWLSTPSLYGTQSLLALQHARTWRSTSSIVVMMRQQASDQSIMHHVQECCFFRHNQQEEEGAHKSPCFRLSASNINWSRDSLHRVDDDSDEEDESSCEWFSDDSLDDASDESCDEEFRFVSRNSLDENETNSDDEFGFGRHSSSFQPRSGLLTTILEEDSVMTDSASDDVSTKSCESATNDKTLALQHNKTFIMKSDEQTTGLPETRLDSSNDVCQPRPELKTNTSEDINVDEFNFEANRQFRTIVEEPLQEITPTDSNSEKCDVNNVELLTPPMDEPTLFERCPANEINRPHVDQSKDDFQENILTPNGDNSANYSSGNAIWDGEMQQSSSIGMDTNIDDELQLNIERCEKALDEFFPSKNKEASIEGIKDLSDGKIDEKMAPIIFVGLTIHSLVCFFRFIHRAFVYLNYFNQTQGQTILRDENNEKQSLVDRIRLVWGAERTNDDGRLNYLTFSDVIGGKKVESVDGKMPEVFTAKYSSRQQLNLSGSTQCKHSGNVRNEKVATTHKTMLTLPSEDILKTNEFSCEFLNEKSIPAHDNFLKTDFKPDGCLGIQFETTFNNNMIVKGNEDPVKALVRQVNQLKELFHGNGVDNADEKSVKFQKHSRSVHDNKAIERWNLSAMTALNLPKLDQKDQECVSLSKSSEVDRFFESLKTSPSTDDGCGHESQSQQDKRTLRSNFSFEDSGCDVSLPDSEEKYIEPASSPTSLPENKSKMDADDNRDNVIRDINPRIQSDMSIDSLMVDPVDKSDICVSKKSESLLTEDSLIGNSFGSIDSIKSNSDFQGSYYLNPLDGYTTDSLNDVIDGPNSEKIESDADSTSSLESITYVFLGPETIKSKNDLKAEDGIRASASAPQLTFQCPVEPSSKPISESTKNRNDSKLDIIMDDVKLLLKKFAEFEEEEMASNKTDSGGMDDVAQRIRDVGTSTSDINLRRRLFADERPFADRCTQTDPNNVETDLDESDAESESEARLLQTLREVSKATEILKQQIDRQSDYATEVWSRLDNEDGRSETQANPLSSESRFVECEEPQAQQLRNGSDQGSPLGSMKDFGKDRRRNLLVANMLDQMARDNKEVHKEIGLAWRMLKENPLLSNGNELNKRSDRR